MTDGLGVDQLWRSLAPPRVSDRAAGVGQSAGQPSLSRAYRG